MTWQSTTPGALSALSTMFAAIDGPTVGPGSDEAITVGFQSEDNPESASGQFAIEGFSASPSREQYSVQCAATVRNGGKDIVRVQSRVFELLAVCGAALATDPTLSGLVMRASLGEWSLQQAQGRGGAQAQILFNVDIDAYTIR